MFTLIEKEVIEGAIKYLNHPDVAKMNFVIPSTNYARALQGMLDSNKKLEDK